jgi:2-isopropylmalate synthase
MNNRHIKFFDTTLRDGEQSPSFSMSREDKLAMAIQLEKLGVDVIEAGFPASSPEDFESVSEIAHALKTSIVTGLARSNEQDITKLWEAVKHAAHPRIHVFLATSDLHLEYKLKKTRAEALQMAIDAVSFARKLCADVEFSCEDASRSDLDYMAEVVEAVINAGASTINLPDTVGYALPQDMYNMISTIKAKVANIVKAVLSTHCHNDLGLAVANSLAAIDAGATQIECTVNGIGERAGNAAIEELVMALRTRPDRYGDVTMSINSQELYPSSRMLSKLTGVNTQPNKAIVGKNAFAHESGIHQDGVLKNPFTYEIMTPESVGFPKTKLVLGKHSGRAALAARLKDLGHELDTEAINKLFEAFKELADKKKEVHDEDLEALLFNTTSTHAQAFQLDYVSFASGNGSVPTATITLIDKDGNKLTDAAIGDGTIDANFKALERLTGVTGVLTDYRVNTLTQGKDSIGEALIRVRFNNNNSAGIATASSGEISARGYSTDIVVASVNAYLDALNRYLSK